MKQKKKNTKKRVHTKSTKNSESSAGAKNPPSDAPVSLESTVLAFIKSPNLSPVEVRKHIDRLQAASKAGDLKAVSALYDIAWQASVALLHTPIELLRSFARCKMHWPVAIFGSGSAMLTEVEEFVSGIQLGEDAYPTLQRLQRENSHLKRVAVALDYVLNSVIHYILTANTLTAKELTQEASIQLTELRERTQTTIDVLVDILNSDQKLDIKQILNSGVLGSLDQMNGDKEQGFSHWFNACKALLRVATHDHFEEARFGLREKWGRPTAEARWKKRNPGKLLSKHAELQESDFRDGILKSLRPALHSLLFGKSHQKA